MSYMILALNPGSTSTKIAVYEDSKEVFKKNIEHSKQDIEQFEKIADQHEMRYTAIMKVLAEEHCDLNKLSAVVGRGESPSAVKVGSIPRQRCHDRHVEIQAG